MSDMRFVIVGVILVFAGVMVLGAFGHDFQAATIESDEFGTCHEYSEDMPPVEINCSLKVFDQMIFFGLVVGLIMAGIISLVMGTRGNWDNKVKPEDMVGPGGKQNENSDEPKK